MQQIPTISQLQSEIVADLETQFQTNIPVFGRVFLRVIAFVQAAKLKLFYLALANIQKNIFADTAEPENIGGTLERFGRVKLNRDPRQATQGEYEVTITGEIGAVINAEQTFKSDDSATSAGKMFVLDNAFTFVSTTGTITLRALEAGTESSLVVGDTLTATSPILNVNSTATVTAETISPVNAEDTETYRAQVVEAYQLEPQGGAASDYRLWSKDAQGVKQSYPFAKNGFAGEINVFVEANIADSIDGKGTPNATIITDVESAIEFDPDTTQPIEERGRRPLGVFLVHVLPITPLNVDITINGYIGLTPQIQTQIENAVKEMVNSIRPYVAACDVLENKNDILDSNKVVAAVINAQSGSVFGAVNISVGGSPVTSYVFANGNIPFFNSINFV